MTVTAMTKGDAGKKPRRRGRLAIIAVVLLLVVVGGAYMFLKPKGASKPVAGAVDPLTSIQINLADGHYLRLGLALQLRKGASADIDGSKALDAAIDLFTGLQLSSLNQANTRDSLRTRLATELTTRYDGDVMGVYFTEFVTQ